MATQILTAKHLRERIYYDPCSGAITEIRSGIPPKDRDWEGYLSVYVDGKYHQAHRLAWLYVYGDWPTGMIDHVNGDRRDNRILNLRDVSNTVNQQNQRSARVDNKLGLLGVNLEKGTGKYKAQIRAGGKKLLIGRFDCPKDAHQAYLNAKRILHEGCTI